MTNLIYRTVTALIFGIAILTSAISPARALQMSLNEDQIVITGKVEDSEVFRFSALLDEVKGKVTTVVFRNSPGGNLDTGYRVAQIIRAQGLGTAVSGYCISACSVMFMGGVRRQFTDEKPAVDTFVGFHGVYNSNGYPNFGSRVFLKKVFVAYSDGKAEEDLVDRWIALPSEGVMFFFDPRRMRVENTSIVACKGSRKDNYKDCDKITGKSGYDVGIFTSRELVHVKSGTPRNFDDAIEIPGYKAGVAAFDREEFAAALDLFRPLAEQGHPVAQNRLGIMHLNGKGVTKNPEEAVRWYRKAADNGYPAAQANLAFAYRNGRGVAKDEAEAVRWYLSAANQGYSNAQNTLGILYENGEVGLKKSYAEAAKWYRRGADQGNAAAQANLATMYGNGRGVSQLYEEAMTWYRKAADKDNTRGMNGIGTLYRNGRGVAKDDAEAATWYTKAAEKGYGPSQENLGGLYEKGEGVAHDVVQAHKWWSLAAAKETDKTVKDRIVGKRDTLVAKMTPAQIAEAEKLAKEWKPK